MDLITLAILKNYINQLLTDIGIDGYGIKNITQTVDPNDSQKNIITITLTNGKKQTLVILNGEQGKSGVYVGTGEMPDGYNIQIDPSGEAVALLTEAEKQEIADKVLDEIPTVETAEVGQTIVVKAIDGNGKPTEWEAADFPSGGGSEKAVTIFDETVTETTWRIMCHIPEEYRKYTNFLMLLDMVKDVTYEGISHKCTWRIYWDDYQNGAAESSINLNNPGSGGGLAHEFYYNSDFCLYAPSRTSNYSIKNIRTGNLHPKISALAVDANFTEQFLPGTHLIIKAWRDNL